jgi:mono/diheme cytochrome c family protein
MPRKLALLALAACIAGGAYFVEIPLHWGLSDEELDAAVRRGRQVFLGNCAPCHNGQPNLPSQRELRQDYSQRDLRRVLENPPQGMAPFSGTEDDRRDLLLFLTRG